MSKSKEPSYIPPFTVTDEIKEVKNAIDAYNLLFELNPYKEKDLLKPHGLMTSGLIKENGKYRSDGVGVFDGQNGAIVANIVANALETNIRLVAC